MFAKIENGEIVAYPYRDHQIRADHPGTSFPDDLSRTDLSEFGAVPVLATPAPDATATLVPVEGEPTLVDGVWTQTWNLEPRPVPVAVTMRQARLALLGAGLLGNVDAAIAAMPSPDKEAATIEWEYAAEVRRDSPLIAALGGALGLTAEGIDGLFMQAATL